MPQILVIPSIDIKNGKTVRVVQGIPELDSSEYGNDPVEMAMIWRAENAKCLHVVDFDAAHEHSHKNYKIIKEICDSVIIPVEMGGGIRSFDDADKAFTLGVFRIVVGSLAYENFSEFEKILDYFGPKKISAAIDVIDNEVVIRRSYYRTGISALEAAQKLVERGIERLIVTDVKTNGMMVGPNIVLSRNIARQTGAKVTHSGGVGSYHDLMKVQEIFVDGVDSVIIGRALYENKFPCQKIWRVAESGIFN